MLNNTNNNPPIPIPTGIEISPKTGVLGNFHDLPTDLPGFYNYNDVSLEDMKQLLPKLEAVRSGMNDLFEHNNSYHIAFNSISHVVLELKQQNADSHYYFHSFYKNAGKDDVEVGNLMSNQNANSPTGTVPSTTPPSEVKKDVKIGSVLTTQISTCGFQMAFIGSANGDAKYIVISHLQNRSKLAAILPKIQWQLLSDSSNQSVSLEVQSVLSIMAPTKESIDDANFRLSSPAQMHSVILMRDQYYRPKDCMCFGFGISHVGLLFNNEQFKLFMNPIYNNLFTSAVYFNIQNLPIFNSTPVYVREAIAHLDERSIDSVDPETPSDKNSNEHNDIIKNYYWTCFKNGFFGDAKYIHEILGKLSTSKDINAVETAFYQHYRANPLNFINNTPFKTFSTLNKSKWIIWKDFITPAAFTQAVGQYTVLGNYYIDMRMEDMASSNATIQGVLTIPQD